MFRIHILILALISFSFSFAGIGLESGNFIYIAGKNLRQPEQIYIAKQTVSNGLVKIIDLKNGRKKLVFNKATAYQIFDEYGRHKIISYYNKNAGLDLNQIVHQIEVTNKDKISAYKDIDSFRWPNIDMRAGILFFQKYNRDVNIFCYIFNPLKNKEFEFINDLDKNIQADAWGEVQKVSERDLSYWYDGNNYRIIYIKNNKLIYSPKPGAPSHEHRVLLELNDEANSPVWGNSGNEIYLIIKNILYKLKLNSNAEIISKKSIKKFLNKNIFKLIPNPLYENVFLYRFESNGQVRIGIYHFYRDGREEDIVIPATNRVDDINPIWAPDGERLAFIRRIPISSGFDFKLYEFNLPTNNIRPLGPQNIILNNNTYPKWLPDGSGLLVIGKNDIKGREKLYLIPNIGKDFAEINISFDNRPFNRLVDIEIYPKNLFIINEEKNVELYLFLAAAKSTKTEIYRVRLGKKKIELKNTGKYLSLISQLENNGIDEILLNTNLNDLNEVKMVEKLRREFKKYYADKNQKFLSLSRRKINFNMNISANYTWNYPYFEKIYSQNLNKFNQKISRYKQEERAIHSKYQSIIKKYFNPSYKHSLINQIKKGTKVNIEEIFYDINKALLSYENEIKDLENQFLDDYNLNKKELDGLILQDKEYKNLLVSIKNLNNNIQKLTEEYKNKIQNWPISNIKEQPLKDKYFNNFAKIQKKYIQNIRYTPENIRLDELKRLKNELSILANEIYWEKFFEKFRSEIINLRKDSEIQNKTLVCSGILLGNGLGKYNKLLLAPYFGIQFKNHIRIYSSFNIGDILIENIISKFNGQVSESGEDSLSYSINYKHWDWSLGVQYKFILNKIILSPEVGIIFQKGIFSFNISPDSVFYYYKESKEKVKAVHKFNLYPYFQFSVNYEVSKNLNLGVGFRYGLPIALRIGGDDFNALRTSNQEKDGIYTPDKKDVNKFSINPIYLGLNIGINF